VRIPEEVARSFQVKESPNKRTKPGSMVILVKLPPGLLSGLPREDQKAIRQIVGKPVLLEGYDDDGRAILTFTESNEVSHSIFVSPRFLKNTG
jgi:hypothetical protein